MSVRISAVVPVHRSQAMLPELHRRLVAALEQIGRPFEILLVEDCGGDDSWSVIKQLAAADPRVRGLRLARNYGQHNALLCGIRAARGELVVTLDDDLQNPPEEIHRLLARLDEGYDVVYGSPQAERTDFSATRPRGSPSSHCRVRWVSELGEQGERVPRLPHPSARCLRGLP